MNVGGVDLTLGMVTTGNTRELIRGVRKWNGTRYLRQRTDLGGQDIFGDDTVGACGGLSNGGVSETKLLDQSGLVSDQFGGPLCT
jgi:hypothetical protein